MKEETENTEGKSHRKIAEIKTQESTIGSTKTERQRIINDSSREESFQSLLKVHEIHQGSNKINKLSSNSYTTKNRLHGNLYIR